MPGRALAAADRSTGRGRRLAAGLGGARWRTRPANAATGADAALRQALAGADWRGRGPLGSPTPPAPPAPWCLAARRPWLAAGSGAAMAPPRSPPRRACGSPRARGRRPDALDAAGADLGPASLRWRPEWRASCVDLDPRADVRMAGGLLRAGRGRCRDGVTLRGGRRHVARLAPFPLVAADTRRSLEKAASGVFDDMALRPMAARARPGRGRSRCAAGLNFRDIMNAVALRDDPEPLGGECAGRIVRRAKASPASPWATPWRPRAKPVSPAT